MILERSLTPEIKKPEETPFPDIKPLELTNGLKCYCLEGGTQEVTKIDVVFKAGSRYEKKPLQAGLTATMLREGTEKRSAYQLSEQFDKYGAQLHTDLDKDRAVVTLLSLNKHLHQLVPLLAEVCTQPAFSQDDLSILTRNAKQRFAVNSQKVQFLCRMEFNKEIFRNTPYAEYISLEDYDRITREELQLFFQKNYNLADAYILISGKDTVNAAEHLQNSFGHFNLQNQQQVQAEDFSLSVTGKEVFIEQKAALQSAIRLGAVAVRKGHPDFFKLSILNTALGGYFGSRLMKNIREDKGFTYGIGSMLNSMEQASVLLIATEVGSASTDRTLEEVFKELRKLREELIPEQELELVKNYLLGNLQQKMDGPFALSDRLRNLINRGLQVSYYNDYYQEIAACTSDDLRKMANKYLQEENLLKVIVGKRE